MTIRQTADTILPSDTQHKQGDAKMAEQWIDGYKVTATKSGKNDVTVSVADAFGSTKSAFTVDSYEKLLRKWNAEFRSGASMFLAKLWNKVAIESLLKSV